MLSSLLPIRSAFFSQLDHGGNLEINIVILLQVLDRSDLLRNDMDQLSQA